MERATGIPIPAAIAFGVLEARLGDGLLCVLLPVHRQKTAMPVISAMIDGDSLLCLCEGGPNCDDPSAYPPPPRPGSLSFSTAGLP